jgi:UDP-N-acetyl-L-fucosamine synthase
VKKLKVVTIVGTRPEIIRLSRLIPKLDKCTDHVLVHTGQNSDRQLNDVFFEDLELRQPDYYLDVDTSSMGSVMGDVLRKSEEVFIKENPDAVMILGDTNSAIAAVVAERMHIPVYHMEAGNRSFDIRVPEELNRKMVDHVASFNLPYNDYSLRNLLAEGIHPSRVHKTGSPMGEIFEHYKAQINSSTVVRRLSLRRDEFFLVSIHRQENVDEPAQLQKFIETLKFLRIQYSFPILVSTHPRTRQRLESSGIGDIPGVTFHEPFGFFDYCRLQLDAFIVISDSGTVSEEANILGFRAITPRFRTERPEAIPSHSVVTSEMNGPAISRVINFLRMREIKEHVPDGYSQLWFSDSVLSIVMSTLHANRYYSAVEERV